MLDDYLFFVSISDLAKRWKVDRKTARAILICYDIHPFTLHTAQRFLWTEVAQEVERLTIDEARHVSFETPLLTYSEVADVLSVSCQSVRNYCKARRISCVKMSSHVHRFHRHRLFEWESDHKNGAFAKR